MALTKISGSILKDPLNLGEVSIGGTLTYQDVTNVDALGIGTFRSGINVSGGQLDVGSNIKLGNAGIITATELDISGDIDVDGHTELDNVNIAGIVTVSSDGINAGILDLKTGGNIRLRFSSGGTAQFRGDTDPIASFDRGSANSTNVKWGYLGADRGIISSISNEFRITASGTTPMTFHSNGSERLRITSAGSVGIGTDNPTTNLQVNDASNESTISLYNAGTKKMALQASNNFGSILYSYDGEPLVFSVHSGSSFSEKLRITSTGKVGIGITNPAVLTHIYDSTNTSTATEQFRISGGNRTADNIETGFRFFTESPSINGNRHVRFTSNGNTGLIIQPYETSTGNAAVDRNILLCPSGGKIGINQSSPQALLHIGNYETGQNVQQSTVTQYFIDSTRSLKIARQSAGNVTTNAAWYTVATLALGGFSYRCQVSLGGNFTQDVVDLEIQTAYSTSLNNKYSFQMTGKAA